MGFFRQELLDWVSIFLLQGIFLTPGSNLCLRHRRRILYQISHLGSPVTISAHTHSVTFLSPSFLVKRLGIVPCTLMEIWGSVCKASSEYLVAECALPWQSFQPFVTPWTAAHQAPLSMAFSRQEYWSGLPLLSPRESSQPRDQTHVSYIGG